MDRMAELYESKGVAKPGKIVKDEEGKKSTRFKAKIIAYNPVV